MERHVTYKDEPLSVFLDFVEMVVAVINRSLINVPRTVSVCMCAGEIPSRRTTVMCPSPTSCPSS